MPRKLCWIEVDEEGKAVTPRTLGRSSTEDGSLPARAVRLELDAGSSHDSRCAARTSRRHRGGRGSRGGIAVCGLGTDGAALRQTADESEPRDHSAELRCTLPRNLLTRLSAPPHRHRRSP